MRAIASVCQASDSSGDTGGGWPISLGASQIKAAISGIIRLPPTLKPHVPIPKPIPHDGLSGSGDDLCCEPQSPVRRSETGRAPLKQAAQMLLYPVGSSGDPHIGHAPNGNDSTPI